MDPFVPSVKLFTGLHQLWSSAGKPKLERCIKGTGLAIFSWCLYIRFILWTWCIAYIKADFIKYELCDIQEMKHLWPLVLELKYCQCYHCDHSLGLFREPPQLYCKEGYSVVVCYVICFDWKCSKHTISADNFKNPSRPPEHFKNNFQCIKTQKTSFVL